MKKLLFLAISLFFVNFVSAQENDKVEKNSNIIERNHEAKNFYLNTATDSLALNMKNKINTLVSIINANEENEMDINTKAEVNSLLEEIQKINCEIQQLDSKKEKVNRGGTDVVNIFYNGKLIKKLELEAQNE